MATQSASKNDKIVWHVKLSVYNFMKGNCVLRPFGMAVYHTGVQLNEWQFCFCVYDTNPNTSGIVAISPKSANYTFHEEKSYGNIEMTLSQLNEILVKLSKTYTCGNYNVFSLNCNHFSDEFLKILVGQGLPSRVFRVTGCLNYLCCCLPKRVVNGQWSLEMMKKKNEQADALLKDESSTDKL